MKIIGKDGSGNFILTATKYELANYTGVSSYNYRVDVGDEIEVSDIYDQFKRMQEYPERLSKAREVLEQIRKDLLIPQAVTLQLQPEEPEEKDKS